MRTRRGIVIAGLSAALALAIATTSASAQAQDPSPATGGTSPPASATNSTLPASTSRMKVVSQVPYYEGGPTFDAYLPKDGRAAHPALIMVHGGGWEGGDMLEFAPFAAKAATDEHWAAFAVNYRLDVNDKSAWPDELHDVQAAIRYIVGQASTYGIDTANVVLMGDSAGANLAALVSEVGTANPVTGTPVGADPSTDVPILAVALWSPPVDLADLVGHAGKAPTECGADQACDFIWTAPDIVDYIGCQPTACPQTYADASPITWVSAKTLPSYIANSTDELIPIGQVQSYVAALQKAGVDVQFQQLPGTLHAVEYGGEVWQPTVAFLSAHLTASAQDEPAASSDDDVDRRGVLLAAGAVLLALIAGAVVAWRRPRATA
ncbi:MAG: alpha/beta hydrolase [Acidimicrobiales bacterium]